MKRCAVILLVLVGACANEQPTRIDGSSPQAFERSAEQARRQLAVADRLTFDRALRTVGGRRFANRDPAALARVTFDNMSAAEIVADQHQREN